MADLLKPQEVVCTGLDGETRTFVISRMPAVQGREIVAKYPMSMLPKVGDYAVNEETMLKLLSFVARKDDAGNLTQLTNRTLVDNHVSDWEMLFQVEKAMLSYNTSFFTKEKTSDFFGTIGQTLKAYLIQTLTDLSAASSKPTRRR